MDGLGFLTIKEVAPLIGMSYDWIYKMICAGHIPHYRRGNKILLRRDEIEQWAFQRVTPGLGRTSEDPEKQAADRPLGG